MNKFRDKTAVAIITCNRQDCFEKAYQSIDKDAIAKIYVVNSGDRYSEYPQDAEVLLCKRSPTVVGIAKNMALRAMKDAGYEFLFLMEDDIFVKDSTVFEKYILTAADSGLWGAQLSYGLHGGNVGGNVGIDGKALKRATVKYSKYEVDFYRNSFQAFTLIHANVLKHAGYMDERYLNACEHLDQHIQMFKKKLGTPFFWFGDILNSHEYIEDQDSNHERSQIRKSPDFMKNFNYSWGLFKLKYGVYPTNVSDVTHETVMGHLEFIEQNFSRKDIL